MTAKDAHRFVAHGRAASQTRTVLKASRMAARTLVAIGSALLVVAVYIIAEAVLERRQAAASSHWPATDGLIVSSEIASGSVSGYRNRLETRYRAAISYSYQVEGKRYLGSRFRFMGGKGPGAYRFSSRQEAEAEVKQYPRLAAIRVYYDPAKPAEAVLEPGLAHYDDFQYYGSYLFLLLPLLVGVIVPLAIKQGARKIVARLAADREPWAWEVARAPPLNNKR